MSPRRLLAATLLLGLPLAVATARPPEKRWYRGNTHTHTLWSDGDAPPELAVEWYRTHGYDFLVLSDHNVVLEGERWVEVGERLPAARLDELVERFGAERVDLREREGRREMRLRTLAELRATFGGPGFTLIPGEELTDKVGDKPVHLGIVNLDRLVRPARGESVGACIAANASAVLAAAKGRPTLLQLNHANFGWGVSPDDVALALGVRFFEVMNGHRGVRNEGDATHPSVEALWDVVLARRLRDLGGPPLLGLASDDAHHYFLGANGVAAPGRGWVVVRAEALTPDAITRALLEGDFYASTGVRLTDVRAGPRGLALSIAPEPGVTFTTRFVGTRRAGEVGAVLAEVGGLEPAYAFTGDELYVRAVVTSSRPHPNGYLIDEPERAWVQPVVPRR